MSRPQPTRPLHRLSAAMLGLLMTVGAGATDLPALVDAAYQRHPERLLGGAERQLGEALARKAEQALAADPEFNLKYQSDAIGSGDGYREWEGGVDLPLWWPGQRQKHRSEAEHTLAAAATLERAKRLEVAGEVRDLLWQAALARSARDQARSDLDSARALRRDVARRVDAGELPRSDLLLARKEVLAREDALADAAARYTQAEQLLTRYTGAEGAPEASVEPLPASLEPGADHPARARAEAAVARARARLERVQADRRAGPSLWLGGKSTRDAAADDFANAVGVEVSIPLGSTAHAAPARAEAGAALIQAQAERDRVLRRLETELEQSRLEHQRAREALERAGDRLALAEDSLRMDRRAFELGESDLVRLLRARADAINARQALETRRLELGRAAARVNQALGVIPQ